MQLQQEIRMISTGKNKIQKFLLILLATSTDANATANADDLEEVVFILQKDNSKKEKVKTDIQDINYIEILSGLNEGDEVITGPYDVVSKTLKDG